ncbi:cardiolipin synthase [Clostridium saccharobutylicum]|uniref:Cardiolipin synthase n=1 Tax=Clostridium saccharobutylicum DSM 13864 TaxID=1345695 RepID=U5MW71_CLOSA|nr:cardiolipin synthase [Clostridium saccharobutylicum]AGX44793.1 cardiolipin synthase Cls [Clostridium saccharobutylicum DSM 13864]AQR92079.1 major cardiolipin synthase ClsA [Clostridium saccharobutylicum]AQS01981.1 major cardiolipin synthase ClsA [Clostridium saccharobutylicum]AQS15964.1 major cardiolipin synthase ClsA [Clostridium saccharobutylicum]MBA2903578.1 cardiolipin synthase [Clostridium saccharobutylicum]
MNSYFYLKLFLLIINFSCAISIIFIERRDSTTIWAWLLILFTFPHIGFILYLCLGQNISKEKIFNKKAAIDKNRLTKLVNKFKQKNSLHHAKKECLDLAKMNFNSNGSICTFDNVVKTYIDGENKFRDLFEDIENAKSFINIQYYIFKYDNLGKSIINLLKNKISEGVEVRLLVDGMGSRYINKKQRKYFESIGIKFSVFFPSILPYINFRINYRNHRKIVVIDDKIGYIGGFNVGDEYINKGKQFSFWRDTHLRIVGDAVIELNKRFIFDWEYASKENIDYKQNTSNNINKISTINDVNNDITKHDTNNFSNVGIQIVSSGPDNEEEYIRNSYLKIINNAKKNVFIQTPYLVLDEPMITALQLSASCGVDVRIMVPNNADHFFMAWALSFSIENLIKSGIKFYKYKNGFIHSKTIVADGCISSVGTANLDIRSFKLNFEINAIIYDTIIAKNHEDIFLKDQEDCHLLTLNEYLNRSTKTKILESISTLVFPFL